MGKLGPGEGRDSSDVVELGSSCGRIINSLSYDAGLI
jgi:hypothetical protein